MKFESRKDRWGEATGNYYFELDGIKYELAFSADAFMSEPYGLAIGGEGFFRNIRKDKIAKNIWLRIKIDFENQAKEAGGNKKEWHSCKYCGGYTKLSDEMCIEKP